MAINLLPWREQQNKRKNQRFIRQLMAIIVILIGLLFALDQYFYRIKIKQDSQVNHLSHLISSQPNIEDIQTIESLYRDLSEQIKKTQSIKKNQADFWYMLATLRKTFPRNLQLKQLSWKNQQLSIMGEADQAEAVTHLIDKLKNDRSFRTISIDTLAQTNQEACVKFSISANQPLSTA